MSEFIRLQANGVDAYPDASTENTYRSNGTSVESALLALESNVNTLGGVAGEAKTLAEQNSVKIATAEQEISDINSSLSDFKSKTKHYKFQVNNINLSNQFGSVYGIDVPFQFGETISLDIADLSCTYVPSDHKSCYVDITALTNESIIFGLTRPTIATVSGIIYLSITEK